MKRPLRRGLSALLALCGAVLILLGIASCGGNSAGVETIADGAYTFSYEMATYGRVKLGFETGSFAAEEKGAVAEKMRETYDAYYEALGSGNAVTVFVLNDARAENLPASLLEGGKLYLKQSALEDAQFPLYFAAAYLGRSDPWRAVAARAAAFGKTQDLSDEDLKAYLSEGEGFETVSLFASYFIEDFATEKERSFAVAAAEKYSEYLLENAGKRALFRDDDAETKAAFLRSLGIDGAQLPAEPSWRDTAEYGASAEYPLTIKTRSRTFYLAPVPQEERGKGFDTPARVFEALSEADAADLAILDTVKKQAPDAYRDVKAREEKGITLYIGPDEEEKTNVTAQTVRLKGSDGLVRETARVLFGSTARRVNWLEEGLTVYFSDFVSKTSGEEKNEVFRLLTEGGATGDDLAFLEAVKARLEELGSPVTDLASYDHVRVLEAAAYVTLRDPTFKERVSYGWAAKSLRELFAFPEADGNELTLPEAYLLVKYAIARLGMDPVLSAAMEGDVFELGMNYSGLLAALHREAEEGKTSWTLKLPDNSDAARINDITFFVFVGIAVALAVAVVLFFTRKKK